jgi:hypothetical protein
VARLETDWMLRVLHTIGRDCEWRTSVTDEFEEKITGFPEAAQMTMALVGATAEAIRLSNPMLEGSDAFIAIKAIHPDGSDVDHATVATSPLFILWQAISALIADGPTIAQTMIVAAFQANPTTAFSTTILSAGCEALHTAFHGISGSVTFQAGL